MKVLIIHGSNRKGSTYTAAHLFADELGKYGEAELSEIFLPAGLPEFCTGCTLCFNKGEEACPHAKYTMPALNAILAADALIFTTPVYVLQASAAVKNFLDHFGHMFVVHRMKPEMFDKKAFIISTTAGAGTRAAIKTISTCLKFWGVNRVYSAGFATQAASWQTMNIKRKESAERKLKTAAKRFHNALSSGRKPPYPVLWFMFHIARVLVKSYAGSSLDRQYWEKQGWFTKSPFSRDRS